MKKEIHQEIPLTEGIKYAGSKLKLLPYILGVVTPLQDVRSILDGFSGTTRVSQAFYRLGYDITTNDLSVWSEVFSKCYLLASRPRKYYQELIDYLNALPGKEGWFTENYGGIPDEGNSGKNGADEQPSGKCLKCGAEGERPFSKHPFQRKNTMKLDAIREEIDRMELSEVDKCVALTSLILALDHVDNTMGHFVSYLADWSARSYKDLVLKVPRFVLQGELLKKLGHLPHVSIQHDDIFNVIQNTQVDLAYFDPPYGSNNEKMPPSRVRYASYYHIWTTVILNDHPEIFGSSARREDSRDTLCPNVFEDYHRSSNGKHVAMEAIERLIRETHSHYILLSYSSGGRATKGELLDILNTHGNLKQCLEIDYRKNVMSSMTWTRQWAANEEKNKEYLFLIEK